MIRRKSSSFMKKNNLGQKLLTLAFMLACMIFGAIGGFLLVLLADKYNFSFGKVMYLLSMIVVNYIIAIIIHESGHLITGLLSGYEFLSFRIGSFTLVKENGKLKRKRFNIIGTGGQCLMMPPDSDKPENVPFIFYFLGGGLFNLLTAIIFIPAGIAVSTFYISTPILILGIVSLFQCLMNLIPLNFQLPNDGYNILLFNRKEDERILFYQQLRINGLMHQGYAPSEMPEKLFEFNNNQGLGYLLKAALYIDKKEFESAQDLIMKSLESETLLGIYEYEAKSELLFCMIMNNTSEKEIDTLFDATLKKYILLSSKTQIAKRRIMYTYYFLYEKDSNSAQREYEAAMNMKKTYPNIGELKSELSLIEYVRNLKSNL